jgi:monovalent cation:H+ antiporter-2, CPA2 family
VKQARMIVYAISDQVSSERAIRLTRKLNSDVKVMVRTRLASQVEELKTAGADVVIPEEFETSIEIFCRVLKEYRIPNNVIEQQVELIRMEGYSMFRGLSLNTESLKKFSTYLTATLTESYLVIGDSWINEKTLGKIDVKGVIVIAVIRKNKPHPNPGADFLVLPGDMLILFGSHMQLSKAIQYLREDPKCQL